ncbi:MAG: biotin--[acetyl-CoA-carboxylase] ligase, partial [Prevotellaceae bacterium]|nr:biotin--[acetyl-CoA-carboxylase] ligase [Prevotellaceae bacterium]
MEYFFVEKTASTNLLLQEKLQTELLPSGFVLHTHYQTSGRGQAGNNWETEAGKNLTFSILVRPEDLAANKNFILAQAVAVAIKEVLDAQLPATHSEQFKIKWSNDIYWKEQKIAGILIENSLKTNVIQSSIIGVGININQEKFASNAPNPVSLCQITGQNHDLQRLLTDICEKSFAYITQKEKYSNIKRLYFDSLYRKEGFYAYETPDNHRFE